LSSFAAKSPVSIAPWAMSRVADLDDALDNITPFSTIGANTALLEILSSVNRREMRLLAALAAHGRR
jgi:hypothetical protein